MDIHISGKTPQSAPSSSNRHHPFRSKPRRHPGFLSLGRSVNRTAVTVELYRKVRLACRDGMSEPAVARHFGISRENVKKILSFSVPPGHRRTAAIKQARLDGFTGASSTNC
ncbi:MAG: hypothetical protein ACMG6H_16865, partial [Acidobacteriota bacterium]